jgi:hypothetical protein
MTRFVEDTLVLLGSAVAAAEPMAFALVSLPPIRHHARASCVATSQPGSRVELTHDVLVDGARIPRAPSRSEKLVQERGGRGQAEETRRRLERN